MEAASAINEEGASLSGSLLKADQVQSSQERLEQGSNLSMAQIDALSGGDAQHAGALQRSLNQKQIADSFQRTFLKLSQVKRRNPNHYIRNPTKVFF